jgi:hypothetical protein
MVLATTFLAPPLLAQIAGRAPQDAAMQPGDGGIDDLVFGTHEGHPGAPAPR